MNVPTRNVLKIALATAVGLVSMLLVQPVAFGASNPPGSPELMPGQARLISIRGELMWFGTIPGDYDQNGVVNISDVTPLGVHFNQQSPIGCFFFGEARAAVDGDDNGEINLADLSVIGQHFGEELIGFNVYASPNSADYPADSIGSNGPGTILLGSVSEGLQLGSDGVMRWGFAPEEPDPAWYCWVRPLDAGGDDGIASTMARLHTGATPAQPENTPQLQLVEGRTLFWEHRMLGDYDTNGEVNDSDLVPIMLNPQPADVFPSSSGADDFDGNSDYAIDIHDLTVIGVYRLQSIGGYHLYRSQSLEDYPAEPTADNGPGAELVSRFHIAGPIGNGDDLMSGGYPSGMKCVSFEADPDSANYYYWVRSFESYDGNNDGIASNWVLVPAAE